MLKAVIFDIDNTLYDYDAAHAAAFSALADYARRELGLDFERFQALHRDADRLLVQRCGGNCSAVHNRLIRYQIMLELLRAPIRHAPEMAKRYWSTLIGGMSPRPGLHEAIRSLKDRKLAIGVGTNMTADYQYEKLKALRVLDEVDFMVTSEEVSAEKPDRRFFERCVEKAGCHPSECAFVGDSFKGDVQGALNAGMRAVWLCDACAEAVPGVLRIASLKELPRVLEVLRCEGA